ncbi:MAG: hypothetical protein IPM16_13700 [Chloroflexi bacterium]|nr:hypothetical protein [Chloroflexota bacterium]
MAAPPMTPPDNAPTARPDRRASPMLATGIVVFVTATVAVFDPRGIIASGFVDSEFLYAGMLLAGAFAALAVWYAAPPRWLVIYAFIWASLICIVALLLIPDIFQVLAFPAIFLAILAFQMPFVVPVAGALATLGLALCVYWYPDRINERVLQFGMTLFCACGAIYLLSVVLL